MGKALRSVLVAGFCAAISTFVAPAVAQDISEAETLACDVMGHDVILYNRGNEAVPAGTVVHWSAWDGRREGDHTLDAPLEPFIGHQLSGALGADYVWDRPCEAHVVAEP